MATLLLRSKGTRKGGRAHPMEPRDRFLVTSGRSFPCAWNKSERLLGSDLCARVQSGKYIGRQHNPDVNLDQLHLTPIAQVLAGAALLLFGRKLFWVFVGIVGFLAGMHFGTEIAGERSETTILLIAIGMGILAAVLAIVLQRVAVALAGALAGGMLAMQTATALGSVSEGVGWFFFFVGAVLSAILVTIIFDWALIGLSALTGANLVSQALPLDHLMQLMVTVMLFIAGVLVQLGLWRSVGNRGPL
jgi:hypothetical protein